MKASAGLSDPELLDDDDLLDAVVEDFTARCRAGQTPQPLDYAIRYPRIAAQLNELLPTIAAIEHTKSSSDASALRKPWGDVPQRLGDFRIVREIGRGGMGVVYEAVQESLGRAVALKVLPPQILADPKRVERFELESRIAAKLHHTNIVPVFGVGCDEGLHYYVMQRILGEGWDRKLLHAEARPTARETARIGRDAARALHEAHLQNTLHRDVKPGNILIGDDGHVWLTDFGLAQILESDSTATAHVAGTLRYLPPERLQGLSDARGDVYSLGVALFEAVAGRPPFDARSNVELMNLITHGKPAELRKLDGRIPRDFETIVGKATAREPNDRYATAAALADDLQRFLDGAPIAARPFGALERAWRWSKRNRTASTSLAAAALALLLLALVSTIGYWRTSRLNEQLSESIVQEQAARRSAETTSGTALAALDAVFERFAPSGSLSAAGRSTAGSDALGDSLSGGDVAVAVTNISPQTAAALESLLPFYMRLAAERGDDPRIRRQAAAAMHRIGLVQAKVGRFEQARDVWKREAELLAELQKATPTAGEELGLALATIDADLGDLERMQDRVPDALAAYRRALEQLEKLTASETKPAFETRRELARVHLALAQRMHDPELDRGPHGPGHGPPHHPPGMGPPPGMRHPPGSGPPPGGRPEFGGPAGFGEGGPPGGRRPPEGQEPPRDDPEETKRHLNAALAVLDELSTERPADRQTKFLKARCYGELAKFGPPGTFEIDSADFQAGAKLLRELTAEYPSVPDYAHELSAALADFNPRALPPEARTTANERLREALALSEKLTQQFPDTTLYAAEQPHILQRMAQLQEAEGKAEAEATYRRGVEISARLTKEFPDEFVHAYWEARMRQGFAKYLAGAERRPEALAEAERAAAVIRPYVEKETPPPPALPLDDQLRRMTSDLRRGP